MNPVARRYVYGVDVVLIIAVVFGGATWWFGVRQMSEVENRARRDRLQIKAQVAQLTRLVKAFAQAAGIDSALIETPEVDSLGSGP